MADIGNHADVVRLGVALTGAQLASSANDGFRTLVALARAADAAKLDSLWIGDHIGYAEQPWFNNLVTLSRLGAETSRIRLGAIVIASLRDPLLLADQLATLDHACDGRLSVCFVAGWRREEFTRRDVPYAERTARALAAVDTVLRLWGRYDPADQDGAGVGLRPAHAVDLWLGGSGTRAAVAAAALGLNYMQSAHVGVTRAGELSRAYAESVRPNREQRIGIIRQAYVDTDTERLQQALSAIERYQNVYRSSGLGESEGAAKRFALNASDEELRAIVGTPEHVAQEFRQLTTRAAACDIISRVGWPGMPVSALVGSIHRLGVEVQRRVETGVA